MIIRFNTCVTYVLTIIIFWLTSLGSLLFIALDIPIPLAHYEATATPAPSIETTIYYQTDFEGEVTEWDLFIGRNTIEIKQTENGNHWLVISIDSGLIDDGMSSLLNGEFVDFDLQVTTTLLSSDASYDNRFGVIFGHRTSEDFYLFEISNDGYYHLLKYTRAGEEEISPWIPTTDEQSEEYPHPTIILPGLDNPLEADADRVNVIRIISLDNRFYFFVNDQLLPLCFKGDSQLSVYNAFTRECVTSDLAYFYEDTNYNGGQIGLSAGTTTYSDPTYPVTIAFDDIIIQQPPTSDEISQLIGE